MYRTRYFVCHLEVSISVQVLLDDDAAVDDVAGKPWLRDDKFA
jgi:hypothetical protein